MRPFDLKPWQRAIVDELDHTEQFVSFYDGPDVTLDGHFDSEQLRRIADILDRINAKP